MPIGFLEKIEEIPDHRIAGMVSYPLDEILPATLVGVLRGADDFEAIELLSREYLAWLILGSSCPTRPAFPAPKRSESFSGC
ncbi:MAG: transposase family protein [Methylocella sp.]